MNREPSTQPGQRWLAADPLLPAALTGRGCGADLAWPGLGGEPAAAGTCEHWHGTPGDLETTFGAAHQFQLTVQMAAPETDPDALDGLLSAWRHHLADVPEAAAGDSAAIIAWPSRDITVPATLLRRGFTCRKVIAARPAGRPGCAATGRDTGIQVRQAGPADLDTVTRLGMEVIRFDAHFGTLTERPDTAEALRRDAAAGLAAPDPWIWLAERDAAPAGLLYARRPEHARWVAPMVRLAPAAYVEFMYIPPPERGRGAGPALAERLHQEALAAGVAVILLHYELLNPLSGPFWARQGYRPLWNIWETRPAREVR